LFATIVSLGLWLLSDEIPLWLTHDALLKQMLKALIPMISVANFALGMAVISGTLLYAQNRFLLANTTTCLVSICVTLPLGALSSVVLHINLEGQTAAVVIGMALTGALNSYAVVMSDWKATSDAVICSHEHDKEEEDHDNERTYLVS
jgi:Na+-driven multidrug efflux pump